MLYPLSYGGSGGAGSVHGDPCRVHLVPDIRAGSAGRPASLPLAGDPPAALRRDRRCPHRGLESAATLACPTACPTRSSSSGPRPARARRLRDQRRAAAGQAGRPDPARARRAGSPQRLTEADGIATVDIAGPGFLNITVDAGAQGAVAAEHRRRPVAAYGHSEELAGPADQRGVRLGQPDRPAAPRAHPLGRRSATPSPGCSPAAGAEVTREFYVNDRGAQMDKFGASLEAAAAGRPVPEDGYHGDYVGELAARDRRGRPRAPRPAGARPAGGVPRGGLPRAS